MIKGKNLTIFVYFFSILLLNLILQSCEEKAESEIYDEIICDAELLNENGSKFITPTRFQELLFNNNNTQTDEQAYSGKYSVKLTKEKAFGMSYIIKNVQPDEHFQASVWRLSEYGNGLLVAHAEDVTQFYIKQGEVNKKDKGWELLILDIIVPQNLKNQDLSVYLWNQDTTACVYFDDLKIRYFPQTQGLKE